MKDLLAMFNKKESDRPEADFDIRRSVVDEGNVGA